MTFLDRCVQTIAHIDAAEALLGQMRIHATALPIRDAMAQQRALLEEAGRHLERARALQPAT